MINGTRPKKSSEYTYLREKMLNARIFNMLIVICLGFGDAINCENSWNACTEYIDEQFQQYFLAESGVNRKHIQDTRVLVLCSALWTWLKAVGY